MKNISNNCFIKWFILNFEAVAEQIEKRHILLEGMKITTKQFENSGLF